MCGIVGYAGYRQARVPLISSLKKLEYRGYDSAGIAVKGTKLKVFKNGGNLDKLERTVKDLKGNIGIGHTRWATHGRPTPTNAHPITDCKGTIAVVHNGIIENYEELKEKLMKMGHVFMTETDTEVVAHLLESNFNGSLENAMRKTIKELKGSYAVAAISEQDSTIIAARKESPLVVGIGKNENFIASDIPALLEYTHKIIDIMDNEILVMNAQEVTISTFKGDAVTREPKDIPWNLEHAEKGGYEHFMIKEIFEQPDAIHNSLLGRLAERDLDDIKINGFRSIKLIACGSSYHASLIGKYILEDTLKVPTSVEMSSEYRYSTAPSAYPLVVLVTQSGETADTLAAAKEAKNRGCYTIAITNVVGSTITRIVDDVIYTRAGIEIGVAATKTFTTQLVAMYILALKIGISRNILTPNQIDNLKEQMRSLPRLVQNVLDMTDEIKSHVKLLQRSENVFFIGRNINYPTALEGALKLKEISYIHAEGYPAGELKHGPLALLTKNTPIVAIAIKDKTYEKMLGNIGEVTARDAPVLAIGSEGDTNLQRYTDHVICIPEVPPLFSPMLATVALQLLSYYVANERKCPIDKPRNLAKSVTVE